MGGQSCQGRILDAEQSGQLLRPDMNSQVSRYSYAGPGPNRFFPGLLDPFILPGPIIEADNRLRPLGQPQYGHKQQGGNAHHNTDCRQGHISAIKHQSFVKYELLYAVGHLHGKRGKTNGHDTAQNRPAGLQIL